MAGMSEVAREAGLNPVEDPNSGKKIWTSDVLDRFFELVVQKCAEGETVRIKNFGSFSMKTFPGRTLKSPLMEGGEVTFPDTQVLRFSQSSVAKALLNKLAPPDGKKPKASAKKAGSAKKKTGKKTGKKPKKSDESEE